MKELTLKQRRFVEAYNGNGVEAAKKAGYRGTDNTLAQVARENLRKPHILELIESREKEDSEKRIADKLERQVFWTTTMLDEKQDMNTRLRASELLGKSQCDFVNKHELTPGGDLAAILKAINDDNPSFIPQGAALLQLDNPCHVETLDYEEQPEEVE